jgi:REP element-mobilizing transposase RayT
MKQSQQQEFKLRTRGGRRIGAGRKTARVRRGVPHRARPEHKKAHPVHVTLRSCRRLPSFRKELVFREIRRALGRTARAWFRVVHYSVQQDHLHLLVEADDKSSLSRGLMGLAIPLARAVNRVFGRTGKVWDERFYARALPSPREVRHAYVIMNAKKHHLGAPCIDPCSSAASFTGWKLPPSQAPPSEWTSDVPANSPVTQRAETWLLRTGWKKHGLIAPTEQPRANH